MSRQPITARVTATLHAPLGGPERGLLVVGILFAAVFVSSLWRVDKSAWAIVGIVGGFLGLAAILFVWLRDGRRFGQVGVPFALAQTGQGTTVTTEVEPSRAIEALTAIREIVQNRQPLPDPHGKVEGDPANEQALSPYTDAERGDVGKALRVDAEGHSRKVIRDVEEAQRALMAPAGSEQGQSEPIGPTLPPERK